MNRQVRSLLLACLMVSLVLPSTFWIPSVEAAEPLIVITIAVVGIKAVTISLTQSQFVAEMSRLASGLPGLVPRPLTDPRPESAEIKIRPYVSDPDFFRRELDRIEKSKTFADIVKSIYDTLKGGIQEAKQEPCPKNYYLCRTYKETKNGIEYTWLEWAKSPKETVSRVIIGIRDVARPFAQVLSPNGREVWRVGEIRTIRWAARDNVAVRLLLLYYSIDGGRNWHYITGFRPVGNEGSINWRVPNTPSTNCLVRVDAYDVAGNIGSDTSDRSFTIRR